MFKQKILMDILKEATIFENAKMSHMSTSDRVEASSTMFHELPP